MKSVGSKPSVADLADGLPTSKSPTEIVEGAAANERNERAALLAGLLAPTPRISQVYLYDARGSELYEEIVRAPEYYLPDTEALLLAAHAAEIVASATAAPLASQAVIELGAGAGERTLALLRAALPLADATAYVPVDVSAAALDACARRRAPRSPALRGRRASRRSSAASRRSCRRRRASPTARASVYSSARRSATTTTPRSAPSSASSARACATAAAAATASSSASTRRTRRGSRRA